MEQSTLLSNSDQERDHIRNLPVFIVLAQTPESNSYKGLIERSFSMDWSDEYVCMFWSGITHSILGQHEIDGKEDAEDHKDFYEKKNPDWKITVFDAHSDDCPIEIDWEKWITASLVGKRQKFAARNANFTIKD